MARTSVYPVCWLILASCYWYAPEVPYVTALLTCLTIPWLLDWVFGFFGRSQTPLTKPFRFLNLLPFLYSEFVMLLFPCILLTSGYYAFRSLGNAKLAPGPLGTSAHRTHVYLICWLVMAIGIAVTREGIFLLLAAPAWIVDGILAHFGQPQNRLTLTLR